MNSRIKYILVGLLILFAIFYFFRYKNVYRSIYDDARPMITLEEALAPGTLKTGDLVLFSHDRDNKIRNAFCTFYQTLLGTEWSHIGIIIKLRGQLYVAESTAKENKKYGASDLNLLSKRLKTYHGRMAFRLLNQEMEREDKDNLIDYVINTRGIPFEDNLVIHVIHDCFLKGREFGQKIFRLVFGKPPRKGFFCTEYVRKIMKKGGIIPHNDRENCDHCSLPLHFKENNKKLKCQNKYSYSNEIFLFYK